MPILEVGRDGRACHGRTGPSFWMSRLKADLFLQFAAVSLLGILGIALAFVGLGKPVAGAAPIVGGSLALYAGLLYVVWRGSRTVHWQRRDLQEQNRELARSRARIVRAQEQLRKEVALQLHGRVQNGILVATTWIHLAREKLESDPAESKEHLRKATQLVEHVAYQDLSEIAKRLHPLAVRFGLITSLRALIDTFSGATSVSLHVPEQGPLTDSFSQKRLSEGARIAIYRIAEEALSNVLNHADADNAQVTLDLKGDRLVVRIEDNGRGFNPVATPQGLGITSMRDYCGPHGGDLEIVSRPGRGTALTVTLPLAAPAETSPSHPAALASAANQ